MRVAIICSLLLTLACAVGCSTDSNTRSAPSEADQPGTEADAIAPGEYVVVSSSGTFASGTGAGAERWSYDADELWSFEVVSVESNWVQVRPPESSYRKRLCYSVPTAIRPVELEFFVRRDDLRAVTTGRVEASYDDGTGLALRPGVAVRRDGEETSAALHGLEIPTSAADDRVGRAYRPEESTSDSSEVEWWKSSDGLVIGGERVESSGRPLPVREQNSRKDGVLAEISDGCGTLRVLMQSPVEAEAPDSSGPEPSESFQVVWVEPDSPLYWLSGNRAGRTGDAKWPLRVRVESRNDRPCFAASFQTVAPKSFESERHFRICVDESNLRTSDEVARDRSAARDDERETGNVSVLQTEAEIRLVGLTGDHSWDQIKRPIASRKNALEQCYKEVVSPEDRFAGEVRLTIAIGPDGSISQVEAGRSTLGREAVTTCLRRTLRDVSFPAAGEGSELEVELVFSIRDK